MRYFISEEKEVTKDEFIQAERRYGFFPKNESINEFATSGFTTTRDGKIIIVGRIQNE